MQQFNDIVWKKILNKYFPEFLELFWPQAYCAIDWSKPYKNLEQELLKIGKGYRVGNLYVDKLFQVYLKDGTEQLLLLHVEVQHSKQKDLEKRMLTYFAGLHLKYNQDIVSLLLLADNNPNWRPQQYYSEFFDCVITYSYKLVKILDYRGQEEFLQRTSNPFGLIVLAQLLAITSKPDQEARLVNKLKLFRLLFSNKWDKNKIRNLCTFIDILLKLDQKLEDQFIETINQMEGEKNMRLITSAERVGHRRGIAEGIERGITQGMARGTAHILSNQLKTKFSYVPEAYLQKIKTAEPDALNTWAINILGASTIEEVCQ